MFLADQFQELKLADEHAVLATMAHRLAQRVWRVLVLGDTRAGKSTWLSALLHKPSLKGEVKFAHRTHAWSIAQAGNCW